MATAAAVDDQEEQWASVCEAFCVFFNFEHQKIFIAGNSHQIWFKMVVLNNPKKV